MLFRIDPSDPAPAEAQIVASVRGAIEGGVLGPGDPLPTARRLAVELRVNPNAVERAYAELQRLGVVQLRAGHGYFVAAGGTTAAEARLRELSALEDEFLRRAGALGFTLDEVIIHLDARRAS